MSKPTIPTQDDIAALLVDYCINMQNANLDPKLFTSLDMKEWTKGFRKALGMFNYGRCPNLKQGKGILENLCVNKDKGCDDGCDVKDNDKQDFCIASCGFGLYQDTVDLFDILIEDCDHDLHRLIQERIQNRLCLIQERIQNTLCLIQEQLQNGIDVHEHKHCEHDRLCLLQEQTQKRMVEGRQLNSKMTAVCRLACDQVLHFWNNLPFKDSALQLTGLLNEDPNPQQMWQDRPKQSCGDSLEEKGHVLEKEIPDGRCLLRALARHILGDPAHHNLMRKAMVHVVLVDSVVLNRIDWEEEGDVFCDVEDYVVNMFCPDAYGNSYIFLAFVKLFDMKVQVHDEEGRTTPITHDDSNSALLDLCNHNDHYDRLVPLVMERNYHEE